MVGCFVTAGLLSKIIKYVYSADIFGMVGLERETSNYVLEVIWLRGFLKVFFGIIKMPCMCLVKLTTAENVTVMGHLSQLAELL